MPPPDISDAALELLERRIADRVTEQARTRVFAYYAVIGTTVAAVFAMVGWSALGWIERQADREIARQIEAKSTQVATASEQLRTLQGQVETQLRILDALATRAARVVDRVESTVASFEPKSRKLEQAITDIDELEERVRPIRGASDLADRNRADIERVSGELASLAQQVKALIEVGRAGPAAPATSGAYSALVGAAERVVTATAGISRDVAASRARATVYLQFAGITREAADSLRAAVAADDFQVPPAERTANAAGLFEVRYYYTADAAAAGKLAEAATAAIRRAVPGETRDAKPVPLLNFRGTRPKEGTLELWYGPPR